MKKPKNSKKGSIALEFAILLPFMLLMFFGSFEVSRYITVNRKIDNAANDLAYVLSREGDLYSTPSTTTRTISASFGANRLNDLARYATPLLMYPYDTSDYVVGMRYVGFPTNSSDANLRLMWAHKYCKKGLLRSGRSACAGVGRKPGLNVNLTNFSSSTCRDPEVQTSDGTCIFRDAKKNERAKIMLRGQGFIMVDLGYPYSQVLSNFANLPATGGNGSWGLNLSGAKEKLSTYVVRSRWVDLNRDNLVQASEFTNNMHVCFPKSAGQGCNVYNSQLSASGSKERKACAAVTPANRYSGGCHF